MNNNELEITIGGKTFIDNACSGDNSLLKGTNGILPFTEVNKTWEAKPKDDNGNLIKTNKELCNCLIIWYNYFSNVFKLDANILAAQAFQESKFALWNYPKLNRNGYNSTATGISQFLLSTIYDVIVMNRYSNNNNEYKFNKNEIDLITSGCTGDIKSIDTFKKTDLIKINRPIIHQNAMDNPKIMIKAQFVYMKYVSTLSNNIASICLYGYNRGHNLIPKNNISYTNTINNTIKLKGVEYPKEGIDYVYKIFNYLGNPKQVNYTIEKTKFIGCFDYNKPPHNINCDIDNFDLIKAQEDESFLLYGDN